MKNINKEIVTALTNSILILAGTILNLHEKLMKDKGIEELSHPQTFQIFVWLTSAEGYMKKSIALICQAHNIAIPYYGDGVKTHKEINEVLLPLIFNIRKVLDLKKSDSFKDNAEFSKCLQSAFEYICRSQVYNAACLVQRASKGDIK